MKRLKRKVRQSLAGVLAFCLIMTSFNMVSWAGIENALENENVIFMINGDDLRDSAQAAIDSGETFHVEDLGLEDTDQSLKREYTKLFEGGTVYEFMPGYEMDEDASAEGAELRMFIRVSDNHDGYRLTGDEEVIFLYVNESGSKITFRSNIDGYMTQKVSVKAFSENTAVVPDSGASGGSGGKPAGAEPGTSGANQEETKATDESAGNGTKENPGETAENETEGNPSETADDETEVKPSETANDETEVKPSETANDETEVKPSETANDETEGNSSETVNDATEVDSSEAANDETEVNSSETADEFHMSSGESSADVPVSISRHVLSILTSSDDEVYSYTESTASEAASNRTSGGRTYGEVLLDESYYAKAYVVTLNQLHIDVSEEGYGVTYAIEPFGTAYVKGPEAVAENETLSFTVTPQAGYEISTVTVNGEAASADEVENSDASDRGKRRYTITGVAEEQEVVITTAAMGTYPEYQFNKTINGVTISLHAEQGILPAGTEARIKEITDKVEDAVKEKAAKETGAESTVNGVLAYDIKLYCNGKELDNSWSDQGYVNVTFSGAPIKEKSLTADSIEIIHMSTDVDMSADTVEKISAEEVTALDAVADPIAVDGEKAVNEISFEAEHFSTYMIEFVSGRKSVSLKVHLMDINTGNEIDYINGGFTVRDTGAVYQVSDLAALTLDDLNLSKQYNFIKATLKSKPDGTELKAFYYFNGKLYDLDTNNKIAGHVYFWCNVKSFTLTYDTNTGNGPVPGPKQYEKGKTVTIAYAPKPEKTGYVFLGWDENKNAESPKYTETGIKTFAMPDHDVTLYAIWKPSSSTVFYVRHWLQKSGTEGIKAEDFELAAGSPEIKYGVTDSKVYDYNYAKAFGGYMYVEGLIDHKTEGTVKGDGTAVLDLYYLKKIKIIVTAETLSKTYDGSPLTGGYQVTGDELRKGDKLEVVVSGSVTDAGQVTNHIERITVMDSSGTVVTDKYDIVSSDGTLTVNKALVTVTADDKTKKYGEKVPALTYSAEGLKNGETLKGLNVNVELYTEVTKTSPVGNYAITFKNPDRETKNYEISYKDGTLYIGVFTGAIEIKALNAVKVYDGKELSKAAYSVKGKLADGDYIDKVVMTEDSRITNAGIQENSIKYVVIKNAAGEDVISNYGDIKLAAGQLIVTKAPAFIIAKSVYKVYGESNPRLEYETTGFVNGETPSGLGIEPKLKTNAAEKSPVGIYPITFEDPVMSTANYYIAYVPGVMVIKRNALDIVITAKSKTKVYDGIAMTESGYEVSGQLASGDYISNVEMTKESVITDVGTKDNEIKSVVIKNASGVDVTKNYSSLKTVAGTLTVSQAQVTVKADDKTKNYGEEVPVLTYSVASPENDETLAGLHVTVEPYTEATKTSPAGDYVIGFRNKAEETKNYKIIYANGTLSVRKSGEVIVIKASDADKVYDGTELTKAKYSVTGSLKDGDYIDKVVMTEDSRIINAGTQKNRIAYVLIKNALGLDVTDSYSGLIKADGTLIVHKATMIVTAANKSKTQGGSNPLLTYSIQGLVNGETLEGLGLKLKLATEADESSTAGNYAIIFVDPVSATANYYISYKEGVLTIERRNTGGSTGGGGGTGGGGLSPNSSRPHVAGGPGDTVTIAPEPVPLADLPEGGNEADNLLLIDDGSIPLAGLPKTGDRWPVQGIAAIVSGILLAAYVAVSRMRKEEK